MDPRKPTRLERSLLRRVAKASKDFGLLEEGDRVMACVSGGKDSYAMLDLLHQLRAKARFDFSIIAVNLDQGQPGFPKEVLPGWLSGQGYEFEIVEADTYSIVMDKVPEGKTYCSLCSRLRRGILYDTAQRLGATKIALGHHREDLLETLLLNIFYSGQLKSMAPKLFSDDGRNVVIRPLVYCAEEDLAAYARQRAFPIIPCDLCGSQENLKRKQIKRLIAELHADNPTVRGNMFAALGNVRVSHLLDPKLRALAGLEALTGEDETVAALEGGLADDDGDDDLEVGCGGAPEPRVTSTPLAALRLGRGV